MNSIKFPSTTQGIHKQLATFIGQLKSHVSSQAGKLDKLSSPLHTPSELTSDAQNLIDLRDQLNALLFSGHACAFTPYQYRIGTNQTLSADSAAEFAANKLTDQHDSIQGQHGLALFVTAYNESTFASNLTSITKILPFPEWLAVADKAAKNAVLDIEKMQVPDAKLNPYWRNEDYSSQNPLDTAEQLLGSEIAQAEAVAESDISPVERLKQLATIQNESLNQLLNDTNNFISLFNGQVYALKLTGTPDNMAKQLREASISSEPYSTLFLMVSNDEPTFFYEIVNV